MPVTYNLIASNTLSSSAASVTFSAIPNTYTDLVLKMSLRASNSSTINTPALTFNGVGGTSYSYTFLKGEGPTYGASSGRASNTDAVYLQQGSDGNTATSSTFSNVEVYIPSYTASQNKPLSSFSAQEDNATTAYLLAQANLFRNTSAISSMTITAGSGANFNIDSSFFLYGIKNS